MCYALETPVSTVAGKAPCMHNIACLNNADLKKHTSPEKQADYYLRQPLPGNAVILQAKSIHSNIKNNLLLLERRERTSLEHTSKREIKQKQVKSSD